MQIVRKGRQTMPLRTYHPDQESEMDWEELEACWPANLIKACCDPFQYALGLRDGTVLRFEHAEPTAGGDWVHLEQAVTASGGRFAGVTLERGIDIAVREIAWVVDAPNGS